MNTPARYIAHKLDPNALAIRDTKTNELYMMFVIEIADPYANYQLTIATIKENDHPYFMFERETFSVKVFCSKPTVLQALVRAMLSHMNESFELSSPSEFAVLMGGRINNELLPLPKRRYLVN